MLDFFKGHLGLVATLMVVMAGVFGLKKKAFQAGDKVGDLMEEAISEKARKQAAEIVTAFAEGLKGETYNGDINLVSNSQIDERLNKVKFDLGLKE